MSVIHEAFKYQNTEFKDTAIAAIAAIASLYRTYIDDNEGVWISDVEL